MNVTRRIRDYKGVSPVIATILMVAITVVLAAVLYLMVSNFTDTGGGGSEPIVALSINDSPVNNIQPVDVASASRQERVDSYYVILIQNETNIDIMDPVNVVAPSGNGYLNFSDINGNNKLDGGDKFSVNTKGEDGTWELVLYWKSSNAKVTSITFSS